MPLKHTGSQHRLQSTPLKPQHTVYGTASQTAKRSTVYSNRRHGQTACSQLINHGESSVQHHLFPVTYNQRLTDFFNRLQPSLMTFQLHSISTSLINFIRTFVQQHFLILFQLTFQIKAVILIIPTCTVIQ